jgi:ribosomal protein L11 methyltransferase
MSKAQARDHEGGWWEFQLRGPLPALEAFAEFMSELGSGGAVFSEDPRTAGEQMVTAFLAGSADEALVERVRGRARFLAGEFPEDQVVLDVTRVKDRDWAKEWKDSLRPTRLEPGLWIVPSHCAVPAEAAGEPVLVIDPGLAFGAGAHATTRRCLAEVARGVKEGARSVLDLGTGTGVLAMTAVRFGAERVLAVDIDPIALRVAGENRDANGLAGRIELRAGVSDPESTDFGETFDLIAANIFPEALIKMLPFIDHHLRPEGRLVLAGIIAERADEVLKAAAARGYVLLAAREDEGWVTLRLAPK